MNINLGTFVTEDSSIQSTSLQGYLDATYNELVAGFGKPLGFFEKSSAMWVLRIGDTIITIYDSVYQGFENMPPDGSKMRRWHIGGAKPSVIGLVAALLGKNVTQGEGRAVVEA